MTDSSAGHESAEHGQLTIAPIVTDLRPMGDLSRFVIKDMEPEEEDEFFAILEQA